jgi:hypothetical protein
MSLCKENIDLRIANARISQEREELCSMNKQLTRENAKLKQELACREEEIENRLLSKSACIVSDHENWGWSIWGYILTLMLDLMILECRNSP